MKSFNNFLKKLKTIFINDPIIAFRNLILDKNTNQNFKNNEFLSIIRNNILRNLENYDAFIAKYNTEFYKLTEPIQQKSVKSWCYLIFKIFLIYPKILDFPDFFSIKFYSNQNSIILSIKCYSPKFCYENIKKLGISTIIFLSGTLSPIERFEKELGENFYYKLENSHIISKENSLIIAINKNFTPETFNFSYANRGFDQNFRLCNFLLETTKKLNFGILIFFPCYSAINDIIKSDICKNILKSIEKEIFIENPDGIFYVDIMSFNVKISDITEYKKSCHVNNNGSMLFCVFRGKINEGIDFSKEESQCVICLGIPYAPPDSNKKSFCIKSKIDYGNLSTLDAMIYVKQAIGRSFRSKDDYGIIILLDYRYSQIDLLKMLPKWVSNPIFVENTEMCIFEIDKFIDKIHKKAKTKPNIEENFISKIKEITIKMQGASIKKLEECRNWQENYIRCLKFRKRKISINFIKKEPISPKFVKI